MAGVCHYGGYRCGHVATDPDDSEHVGATVGDSSTAELSGMVWALIIILQHCGDGGSCSRGVVYYDSLVAAHIADGTWTSSGSLASVATGLSTLLDFACLLDITHEKGHDDFFEDFSKAFQKLNELGSGVGMGAPKGVGDVPV